MSSREREGEGDQEGGDLFMQQQQQQYEEYARTHAYHQRLQQEQREEGEEDDEEKQHHDEVPRLPQPPRRRAQPSNQKYRMMVIVGIPCSGKSTVSECLSSLGWEVVNQDTLKTRPLCERAARQALGKGGRVVIDRCNFDAKQRAHFTGLAREQRLPRSAVACAWLDIPLRVCLERLMQRKGHPTLPPGERSKGVVRRFQDMLKPPREGEGFAKVFRICNDEDLSNFILAMSAEEGDAQQEGSSPTDTWFDAPPTPSVWTAGTNHVSVLSSCPSPAWPSGAEGSPPRVQAVEGALERGLMEVSASAAGGDEASVGCRGDFEEGEVVGGACSSPDGAATSDGTTSASAAAASADATDGGIDKSIEDNDEGTNIFFDMFLGLLSVARLSNIWEEAKGSLELSTTLALAAFDAEQDGGEEASLLIIEQMVEEERYSQEGREQMELESLVLCLREQLSEDQLERVVEVAREARLVPEEMDAFVDMISTFPLANPATVLLILQKVQFEAEAAGPYILEGRLPPEEGEEEEEEEEEGKEEREDGGPGIVVDVSTAADVNRRGRAVQRAPSTWGEAGRVESHGFPSRAAGSMSLPRMSRGESGEFPALESGSRWEGTQKKRDRSAHTGRWRGGQQAGGATAAPGGAGAVGDTAWGDSASKLKWLQQYYDSLLQADMVAEVFWNSQGCVHRTQDALGGLFPEQDAAAKKRDRHAALGRQLRQKICLARRRPSGEVGTAVLVAASPRARVGSSGQQQKRRHSSVAQEALGGGRSGESLRQAAREEERRMREVYKDASSRYRGEGGKGMAAVLSHRGMEHRRRMQELNVMAGWATVKDNNPGMVLEGEEEGRGAHVAIRALSTRGGQQTVDLHGLRVSEAIQVVQATISFLSSSRGPPEGPGGSSRRRNQVDFITGRGNHSAEGRARLQPAIQRYLTARGSQYSVPHPGMYRVQA